MVRYAKSGWWVMWLLAGGAWAQESAAPLRLCVDARPHPPYVLREREGTVQVLVRMAAARAGLQVAYYHAPVARCAEEIRLNLAQGYPAAGYSPKMSAICSFPMEGKEPDPLRATVVTRVMLYRRVGDAADWDGKRLSHTTARVLISHGAVVMQDRLRALGIAADDGGADLATNFAKLLARRGDLALGFEMDGQLLLASAPFAGRIEALPVQFGLSHHYLCLSNQFMEANPERAAALWEAIPKVAASPEYRAAIKGIK